MHQEHWHGFAVQEHAKTTMFVKGFHASSLYSVKGSGELRGTTEGCRMFTLGVPQNIPVEIFVTKSEASGPLQNGFWLPFCAKF